MKNDVCSFISHIQVDMEYQKKIDCSEEELKNELTKSFGLLGGIWLSEVNAAKQKKEQPSQIKVIKAFLDRHILQFQNASKFFQIMLCTAANTSPVERGYTILQMVCAKRRNRITPANLEILFLLGTLKIPVKSPEKYSSEIERLRKKKIFTVHVYVYEYVDERKRKFLVKIRKLVNKLANPHLKKVTPTCIG